MPILFLFCAATSFQEQQKFTIYQKNANNNSNQVNKIEMESKLTVLLELKRFYFFQFNFVLKMIDAFNFHFS